MVGRVRSLGILRTGDPALDRVQDHVKQQLDPVLQNPLLSAVDFRCIEVQGADPATAPTFALQYRSASTAGGAPAWSTIASWDSTGQIVSPLRGIGFSGTSGPSLAITSASGWSDVPGTSFSFAVRSTVRSTKAVLMLSGYPTVAAPQVMQVRWVSDGAMISNAYNFVLTTAADHRNISFQWAVAGGGLGAIGTSHTLKAQVQVVTGGGSQFNMDTNDSAAFVVEEIG